MAMTGITPNFSVDELVGLIHTKLDKLEQGMLRRMSRIGEKAVNMARTKTAVFGNYKDRTKRLRNSIGYMIVKDGREYKSWFPGDGEGASTGKKYAKSILANYPDGFALVVVAGMEYALNVESKGYDVISNTKNATQSGFKAQMDEVIKNFQAEL